MTTNGNEERPLPYGWHKTTLEDVALIERGITFPSSAKQKEPFEGGIICLRTTNVQENVDWDDLLYVPETYVKKDEKIIRKDDILISMANSYELVGKVSFVDRVPIQSSFGGFIAAIRTYPDILPKYLFYHLRTRDTQSLMRRNSSQTVNIANLSLRRLYPTPIRIAPLPEQERIVAEIEKQFTRLDQAVASLKRLQSNLASYKASVLKAACEGRLVPQNPSDEPAQQLLARILAERRTQWETAEWQKLIVKAQKKAAQATRKAQGRPARIKDLQPGEWESISEADYARYLPKNEKWKEKYKEPRGVETAVLPDLPEGWVWVSVGQVGSILGGLTKNAKRRTLPLKMPYLRVANVYANKLKLEDVATIGIRESELNRVLLEENDLLVVEGNGSIEQIGRVALWNGSISPCVHQNHLIKVRFLEKDIADFVLYWLLSPNGRRAIQQVASSTSGLHTLSLSKVSALPLPLPPLAEQKRIVAEVERRLSVVTATEQAITTNLARAERLRQSILGRAFTGQLV